MRLRTTRWAAMGLSLAVAALAQDPVKVDPKHYKVEMENARVRVLRIHYGPHEKSVMHSHPADVAVFLTDVQGKFTYPDGKTESISAKAGQTQYSEAVTHLPRIAVTSPSSSCWWNSKVAERPSLRLPPGPRQRSPKRNKTHTES